MNSLHKRNILGMSHHNSNKQFPFVWLNFILKFIDLLTTPRGKNIIHGILSLVFNNIFIFKWDMSIFKNKWFKCS